MENETKKTAGEIQNSLAQFTGTQHHYKHLFGLTLTDGTKYVAEVCQAYWLMDIVASYLPKVEKTGNQDFALVRLTVKDGKATFTMRADSGEKAFITQQIDYTDFPLGEIEMYLINRVLILKTEY